MTYHYEPEELAHSDQPHTCSRFNPERPPAQWVQDGWYETYLGAQIRIPRMVQIQPEWISNMPDGKPFPCQYSDRKTAVTCKHCPRRES